MELQQELLFSVQGVGDVIAVEIDVTDSTKAAGGAVGAHEASYAAGVATTEADLAVVSHLSASVAEEKVHEMETGEVGTDFDASVNVIVEDNQAVGKTVESRTESVSGKERKKVVNKKQRTHRSPMNSDTSSGEETGDFDSMGTSKAGMSHYGSDFDVSFPGPDSIQSQVKLKKIIPGDPSTSGSSSDSSLHHKVAGGQDETGLTDDLPNNKRSVINREMKKDLKNDKQSSDKDSETEQGPGDLDQ